MTIDKRDLSLKNVGSRGLFKSLPWAWTYSQSYSLWLLTFQLLIMIYEE